MLEVFYPKKMLDSAYEIPYETMYERGIRGVIFDIDNTLVPHGAPADERSGLIPPVPSDGYENLSAV